MRRIVRFGLVAFLGSSITGAAVAADLPPAMPVKAPVITPPVMTYDWNGFYLGINYGTVLGQSVAGSAVPSNGVVATADVNKVGLVGGVQAGVNWQIAPNWLIGLEGDIGYMGVSQSNRDWFDGVTMGVKTDRYGTIRARTGYVTGPSLLYVTGGAAFVHLTDTFGGDALAGLAPTSASKTQATWTAGGGIETKLSRNWSATTEYLYIDAGSQSFAANPYGVADIATISHRFHVIKTGLNYRFGGPAEKFELFDGSSSGAAHDWRGFYVGANVGLGLSATNFVGTVGVTGQDQINGSGFAGGALAGYNVMLGPKWFAGIEGDFGYLGLDRTYQDWGDVYNFAQKTHWYSTLRGRVGRDTGPALLYLTAGATAVNTTTSITLLNPILMGRDTSTGLGWTFGGGTEVALDSRWSAKLEALYIDVGRQSETTTNGFGLVRTVEFQRRFQVVRAGVNYRFGGDEVISSRY